MTGRRPADRGGAGRAARDARRRAQRTGAGAPRGRRGGMRPTIDERPPAPWGSFPLVEVVVLLAIVLLVVGLLVWGPRGQAMVGAGLVLGSLAGLELSFREHLAGYRSHTTLLAAAAAIVTLTPAFSLGAPPVLALLLGALAFGLAFWALREAFKRRSGGLGFR